MNKYKELKNRQQEEFNKLPISYAFGNQQFTEMMKGWGLDPEKDIEKIYCIGNGGYYQKKDQVLLHETMNRFEKEVQEAIAEDKTGDNFIYEMFLCELRDHEYSFTRDGEDALDALGYTLDQVQADKCLKRGFEKAKEKITARRRYDCFDAGSRIV